MNDPESTARKYMIRLASCSITAGAKRALLCDLQRGAYYLVPRSFSDLIDNYHGWQIQAIYDEYGPENKQALDEFFAFMIAGEFIFLSDHAADAERFIRCSPDIDSPGIIQNAIIDIDKASPVPATSIIPQLIDLGCLSVQIRAFSRMNADELISLAMTTEETACRNIEFIVPFDHSYENNQTLTDYFFYNQRIGGIVCYNAPRRKMDLFVGDQIYISQTEEEISSEKHCGIIGPAYFAANQKHFLESQQHNTCLWKKIAIDKRGFIKNCPSMQQHYGNIADTPLKQVVNDEGFRHLWGIHKEMVKQCRDCEFRHVCTDCRAYLEEPADIYSKPLKCGYNPYSATWSNWATNPLKQKAIDHYELREAIRP
ncbi:grasp-with-spasm system SPASM domain peptide maturase [Chitinophaga sp. RAB17]|uniref:grasp-with-spasm system SPASM domain peptide maturase n=1 Tax=Chitinophaga sp. RAB17 TaxID=3233049 RepID=UPI003F932B2F